MKRILGLDLGINSIGWALVEINHEQRIVRIIGLGSRIIPMNATELSDFEQKGIIKSAASQRTKKRGVRRVNERFILRRDRLHLVLNVLKALPEHYKLEVKLPENIQDKRTPANNGSFKKGKEPKLAYTQNKDNPKKFDFQFMKSYNEMLKDFGVENIKGQRVPYDWTLYYLRKKALEKGELTLNELAWVLLSYNQKRGYEKTEVIDKSTKVNEIIEELDLRVKNVSAKQQDKEGKNYFEIQLEGNDKFLYKEYADKQMTFKGDLKEVTRTTKTDDEGNVKEVTFTITDIYSLKIDKVDYKNEEGKHYFILHFNNGWKKETKPTKKYTFKYKDAIGKEYDYIIKTKYDKNGNVKLQQGDERNINEPDYNDDSSDWTLLKKKTEKKALIFNANNGYVDDDGNIKDYISLDIYNTLKKDTQTGKFTKIIGGKFQVVDRKFYREELNDIIRHQKKYHTKLKDKKIIKDCIELLYPNNKNHQKLLKNKKAIEALLVDDILLYQRPLKSKKGEIANCKYEIKYWVEQANEKTGEITEKPYYKKVVSTSHPLFQEFRIWDKIHNLKLIEIEQKTENSISTNVDVTKQYFKNSEDYQKLFDFFNNRKVVNQTQFLNYCKKKFKINTKNFKWNFPEVEELKGNETRISFITRFKRCGFKNYNDFLTLEKEIALWHYLYSVSYKERTANDNKSLKTFFINYFKGFEIEKEVFEKLVEDFKNYPQFPSRYCAYSYKALNKLLPFIRMGNNRFLGLFSKEEVEKDHWKKSINERINTIIEKLNTIDFNVEVVDYSNVIEKGDLRKNILPFPKGLFNAFKGFNKPEDFTNLNLTQASYLIYGRHSELNQVKYWKSPKQITDELHKELKHNSLNNPIAEKVLLEMMQVVAEIWEVYGEKNNDNTYKKLFDRIHIEVGRELKKSAKEKKKTTKTQGENRKQNDRLRKVLKEFLYQNPYNAKPNNKDHFDRLKIVEDGARLDKKFFEKNEIIKENKITQKQINDILKKEEITKQDFDKYRLWIEQGYKSPYTNKMIKLSDLFDGNKYNIDHIFPQAAITNNSLSNKVVCETEINKDKGAQTGRAYILASSGKSIKCEAHNKKEIKIINDNDYVEIVKQHFSGTKREILLSKEIPNKFISAQLNTSRHIARKAMELLSHIVREEGEVEYRSKNVLPVTGAVTNTLKRSWKLDHIWKELVAPRFIRMNKLTQSNIFGNWRNRKDGKIIENNENVKKKDVYFDCKIDNVLLEQMPDFNIKRIDHRHHALDALIVALCTEEHVNYINNIKADSSSKDYGKQKQIEKYRLTLKKKIKFSKPNKDNPKDKDWFYMLPGEFRQKATDDSSEKTKVKMNYLYKNNNSFNTDYKTMILSGLQNTVVTFKQNKRVINKSVNKYQKWDKNKQTIAIQEPEKLKEAQNHKKKYNWAVRRSLGEETFYGKVFLGETTNKQLHKIVDILFKRPYLITDEKLRNDISILKENTLSYQDFKAKIKNNYPNKIIEIKVEKMATRKALDNEKITFNSSKIEEITDTGIQKILKNHLIQFDTVKLPFEEAIEFYDSLLEKDEFEAIIKDKENEFNSKDDFIEHLKTNKYKFKKNNYSELNVFVEQVHSVDLRNESKYGKITEHPEIAFTPEKIDNMNQPENLKQLNEGKNHAPIKKVRIASGYGKQRQISTDIDTKHPVKLKQYVVNDAGSNLFLGVYEREYIDDNGKTVKIRIFKDIGLIELIETLKQDPTKRENPLPNKIYDVDQNKYDLIFTLSPLDLVYVPTEEEIDSPKSIDIKNLSSKQKERIYKYVDGSETKANFVKYSVSSLIWRFHNKNRKKIYNILKDENLIEYKKENELIQNEFGLGSQQDKNERAIDGIQIKKVCWKLKIDRLGNIKDFINKIK